MRLRPAPVRIRANTVMRRIPGCLNDLAACIAILRASATLPETRGGSGASVLMRGKMERLAKKVASVTWLTVPPLIVVNQCAGSIEERLGRVACCQDR